jgi:hypothetical protein
MDADAKELKISKDDAKKVIKALQADLDNYNADHGTPDDIKSRGHIKNPAIYAGGPTDQSGYPAGRTLATYLANAQNEIPAAYAKFLDSYSRVIQALGDMTGVYDKADDQNMENNRRAASTNYYGDPNSQA